MAVIDRINHEALLPISENLTGQVTKPLQAVVEMASDQSVFFRAVR